MKNPRTDKKQNMSSDVPGVNPRNIQVSPDDTVSSGDKKDVDLRDKKGNGRTKAMMDGAEGEGA